MSIHNNMQERAAALLAFDTAKMLEAELHMMTHYTTSSGKPKDVGDFAMESLDHYRGNNSQNKKHHIEDRLEPLISRLREAVAMYDAVRSLNR